MVRFYTKNSAWITLFGLIVFSLLVYLLFWVPVRLVYKNDTRTKCRGTVFRLQSLTEEINLFYQKNGQLPCELNDVFVNSNNIMDAWDIPVKYKRLEYDKFSYRLYSAGPDHKFLTSDDIYSNVAVSGLSGSHLETCPKLRSVAGRRGNQGKIEVVNF